MADREVEIFQLQRTHAVYDKRKAILAEIPKFWYIVLAENDDFAEYVSIDDLKYLEDIENIYVEHRVSGIAKPTDDDLVHYKDFSITITFNGNVKQTVTKQFQTVVEDGEEKLYSTAVDVEWPQDLKIINPQHIKHEAKHNNRPLSKEDKANYRLGMKSFFSWFAWTGDKPGKEYRHGEDLTRLIVDDLYVNALKYYIVALPGNDDEDDDEHDSSDGEELDLSEDDDDSDKKRQRVT